MEVDWQPFELRPEPAPTLDPQGEYLRTAWARSVYPLAERLGVEMRLPSVQPRTRLAHEAFEYGRRQGRGQEMAGALFRAFFQRGWDIGQVDVLVAIGEQCGIAPAGLRQCLEQRTLSVAVGAALARGLELGITAVPTFIIGANRIRGLPALEDLRRAVAQAGA